MLPNKTRIRHVHIGDGIVTLTWRRRHEGRVPIVLSDYAAFWTHVS
jgi:hypothetical protein